MENSNFDISWRQFVRKPVHKDNSREHWEFDSSLSCSSLPLELGWIRSVHGVAEISVVPVWQRSAKAQRGGDRSGHGMARSMWARLTPMGLFDFLLLIFVFWAWMGSILDSYGLVFWILMGFGLDLDWLVGLAWRAVVVGRWALGCLVVFAMGLLGFVLPFFFFFFFGFLVPLGFWWVEGSDGVVGMVVAWWALFIWLLRKWGRGRDRNEREREITCLLFYCIIYIILICCIVK